MRDDNTFLIRLLVAFVNNDGALAISSQDRPRASTLESSTVGSTFLMQVSDCIRTDKEESGSLTTDFNVTRHGVLWQHTQYFFICIERLLIFILSTSCFFSAVF